MHHRPFDLVTAILSPRRIRPCLRVSLVLLALLAVPWIAQGQGTATNGGLHPGEISPAGDTDDWTFTAVAGGSVMIRVGATNFTPRLRLFGPDNALVAETTTGNTLARDGVLSLPTTNGGSYRLLVSASFAAQTGSYGMHLAQLPGALSVPAGDEGGDLPNGALVQGQLTLGDLDTWTFTAGAGDGLMVRMGADTATPWVRVYGPDGALVDETTSGNTLARDGSVNLTATNAGTYSVVVSATYGGQTGPYRLTRIRAPGPITVSAGDQGGELGNGSDTPGALPVGDLDLWGFSANAGDHLMIRMGATNLTPWIRLYDPAGRLAAEDVAGNTLARDGVITLQATNGGDYRLVVGAAYAGQTGPYHLHLAKIPGAFAVSEGDEGGELANGRTQTALVSLGDLDLWRYDAVAGSGMMLRVGATNFTPWLRLYGPTGDLVAQTTSGNTLARDGSLELQATNAGAYTLVVSATYSGQSGPYSLQSIVVPGDFSVGPDDEGGSLINGLTNSATLNLGDVDVWSFIGTPGDSNVLRVASTGFTPWLRLYGPDGSLVGETTSGNTLARAGQISFPVTNAGTYTVVVSATYAGQSGTYSFKQSRFPPDLVLPEIVPIDESRTFSANLSAQDPDEPVKPLQFALISGPAGAGLALAGPTNAVITWPTSEVEGPSTNEFVATVTDLVGGRAFTRTNRFTLVVREINTAPSLVVPDQQVIDESTPLAVQASASDPDLPANELTFRLESAPDGLTIDPATGAIAWLPSEADGPSRHTVTVVVEDSNPWAANETRLAATNSFELVVNEVNRPPVLPPQADRVMDEGTPLAIPNTATDPDLPANGLVYSFLAAPVGATIGADGVITWIPTEAQGPSTNLFVTVVRDDGSPSASATNQFTVVVREVNTPPITVAPNDATVAESTPWELRIEARDDDLPANDLAFLLVDPPAGMTLDPLAGLIRWTPTEAQGPSTNLVTVVVTDRNPWVPNGSSLSVTNRFRLTVSEINASPTLDPVSDQVVHYGVLLELTLRGTDADLPANTLTYGLDQGPEGMNVNPGTGALTWTPPASQVGTHQVTVSVADDGTPSARATVSFSVTVTGEGARLTASVLSGGLIQLEATGDTGARYELQGSGDLTTWDRLTEFQAGATAFRYIDPESTTRPVRFYRLLLRQP